jgi:hypothetical protein
LRAGHAVQEQHGGKAGELGQKFHAAIDGLGAGSSQVRSGALLEMNAAKFVCDAWSDHRALRDFFDSKDTAFGSKAFGS